MATDENRMDLIELDLPKTATPAKTTAEVDHNRRMGAPVPGAGVVNVLAPNVRQAIPMPAGVAFCDCPLGTRGDADSANVCIACKLPRRPRTRPAGVPAATVSAESSAVAASLGVQTSTRTAGDVAREILTPRETALREMRERLRVGHGATSDELKKWEVMFTSEIVTASARPSGYVRHTEVVAGAKSDASGIFTGFGGQGTLTRGEMLSKLREGGFPEEWALPAKSAHAQAGRVLQGLARGGLIVRAARVNVAASDRTWRARWTVGAANGGAGVGGAFGTTLLVVSLGVDDRLVIEGDIGLGVKVRTEFEAAVSAEEYSASDISVWLGGVLMDRFRAARVGGNWYVRQSYAIDAERLLTVFSRGWGCDWLLPAIPMSTGEQLAAGLAKNFIAEAEAVLATYRKELAGAEKKGEKEIGSKRASTLHREIRELAERATGYALMIGDRNVAEIRGKLAAAANKIAESIDGLTQRFELIFDGLREEAARKGIA